MATDKTTTQACKETQIAVETCYRWRGEYGGLKLDQAKRRKDLEQYDRSTPKVLLKDKCEFFRNP